MIRFLLSFVCKSKAFGWLIPYFCKKKKAILAKDLLSDEIPTLKTSDTALEALWIMEQSKVSQLPIVEEGRFLGLLCENDIFDLSEPG